MANNDGHVRSLDALRGLLALYVAIHHVGLLYSPWWSATGSAAWLLTKFSAFGHAAVIAFFLLSGFAMMRSHGADPIDGPSLNRYAFRRVRRLYGVYLGALVLTALLSLHREGLGAAASELPANLLLLQGGSQSGWRRCFLGNTPLWSLTFEAAYYIAFPALLLLGRRLGPRALVATVVGLGLAGWVSTRFGGVSDAAIAGLLPAWWAGAWLATRGCAALRWRVPAWLAGYALGLVPLITRSVPDPTLSDLLAGAAFLPLFVRLVQRDPDHVPVGSLPFLAGGAALLHAACAWLLLHAEHRGESVLFERIYLSAPLFLAALAPSIERLARRPFARPALLGLCGISYGLYACHFPVLALGRDLASAWRAPAPAALAIAWVALAVAFGLAWFLEHPFHRRWADWLGRRWPPMSVAPLKSSVPLKARYRVLDALRGIAALGVVFFHVTIVVPSGLPATLDRAIHVAGKVGACGVDVFFVLSGVCITLVYRRSREFILRSFFSRRWTRLWPTFAVSAVVLAVVHLFLDGRTTEGMGTTLVANAVFYPGLPEWAWAFLPRQDWIVPVYWTLAYEAQFYLVFPLLVFAWRRYGFFKAHYAGLALSVAAYLIDPNAGLFLNRWFQFLLGCLLCDLFVPREEGRPFAWRHLAFSNLVVALTGFSGFRWEATLLAQGLLLLAFGMNRWGASQWLERALAWIGVFSYSLYLYHDALVLVAARLASHVPCGSDLARAAFTAPFALLASLVGSWLMFRLVERRFL